MGSYVSLSTFTGVGLSFVTALYKDITRSFPLLDEIMSTDNEKYEADDVLINSRILNEKKEYLTGPYLSRFPEDANLLAHPICKGHIKPLGFGFMRLEKYRSITPENKQYLLTKPQYAYELAHGASLGCELFEKCKPLLSRAKKKSDIYLIIKALEALRQSQYDNLSHFSEQAWRNIEILLVNVSDLEARLKNYFKIEISVGIEISIASALYTLHKNFTNEQFEILLAQDPTGEAIIGIYLAVAKHQLFDNRNNKKRLFENPSYLPRIGLLFQYLNRCGTITQGIFDKVMDSHEYLDTMLEEFSSQSDSKLSVIERIEKIPQKFLAEIFDTQNFESHFQLAAKPKYKLALMPKENKDLPPSRTIYIEEGTEEALNYTVVEFEAKEPTTKRGVLKDIPVTKPITVAGLLEHKKEILKQIKQQTPLAATPINTDRLVGDIMRLFTTPTQLKQNSNISSTNLDMRKNCSPSPER